MRHINENDLLSQVKTKDMEYLLRNSDFIIVHLPYTESTKKIISQKEIDMMKPTARMVLHAAICIDEVLSGKQPSFPVNKI